MGRSRPSAAGAVSPPLSARDLAVGPLAHRADRPGDAVGGAPGRRRGRAARRRASGSPPSSMAALRMALTWRRRRRSHERQNSGSFVSPRASLTRGQVAEQSGHVLEVLDRQAKRLVALQEAIEDGAPHRPEVRSASLGGDPAVQVVPCGQRAQLARAAERSTRPPCRAAREQGFRRMPTRGGRGASTAWPAGQVELAIATILGGVKGHAATVFHDASRCSCRRTRRPRRAVCYGAAR